MRILVAGVGSLGDLLPLVGLARELRTRGHELTLAASEYFRAHAAAAEIAFVPLDDIYQPFKSDGRQLCSYGPKDVVAWLLKMAECHHAALLAAARRAETMVTYSADMAAVLVARQLALPWVSTAISSPQLPSRHDPIEWPLLVSVAHRLADFPGFGVRIWRLRIPIFRHVSRLWFREFAVFTRAQGVEINDHPLFDWPFSPRGTAALFSPLLMPPRPDWPPGIRLTGHIPYVGDPRAELPEEVRRFLDAGSEPLVFMLGSWSSLSEAFNRASAAVCRRMGRRGILVAPGMEGTDFGRDVLVTGYVPADLLIARAAAVVHHGGIGTVHLALRAGKPMLVVPHFLDQYAHAWRVCRLGTARALRPADYRAARAAAALEALLASAAVRARAAALRDAMLAENGASQAAAFVLERLTG